MADDIHTIRNQQLSVLESFNAASSEDCSAAEIQARRDVKNLDQNIAVDSLDGDSGFVVRADHVASHLSMVAKREYLSNQKQDDFHRLLMVLNDLSDTIRREFIAIQNSINELYKLSEKALEHIEASASLIDQLLADHEAVEHVMATGNFEMDDHGELKNKAAHHLMERYTKRTGNIQGQSEEQIILQLIAQLNYEKTVVIPKIESKVNELSVINDHIILQAESLEEQMKILDDEYQSILDQPDSPEKVQALQDIQARIERLAFESENAIGEYEHDLNTITNKGDTEFLYTEIPPTPENEFTSMPSELATTTPENPTRQSFLPKPL